MVGMEVDSVDMMGVVVVEMLVEVKLEATPVVEVEGAVVEVEEGVGEATMEKEVEDFLVGMEDYLVAMMVEQMEVCV